MTPQSHVGSGGEDASEDGLRSRLMAAQRHLEGGRLGPARQQLELVLSVAPTHGIALDVMRRLLAAEVQSPVMLDLLSGIRGSGLHGWLILKYSPGFPSLSNQSPSPMRGF